MQTSFCRSVEAAIRVPESLTNHAAQAIKVGYAQVATFAKFGAVVFLVDVIGPTRTPTASHVAVLQLWRF